MDRKKLSERSHERKILNVGLVMFTVLVLIIVIRFALSLREPHPTIYEVQKIALAKDNLAKAVVVREEQTVTTDIAGYVNYYTKSGTRVAKDETVFSVDKNRTDRSSAYGDGQVPLSEEDVAEIKNCIEGYYKSGNSGSMTAINELKTNLQSTMAGITDMYLLENLDKIRGNGNPEDGLKLSKAPYSGIVSFFTDSLDGLTADAVSEETFDLEEYTSKTLYSSELREAGSPAYKLVTNENWSLILKLTKEQYTTLEGQSFLTFTITDDGLQLTMPFKRYSMGDGLFARIDLSQYMIRYIGKRFITVAIDLSQAEGLKIPAKAIVEKYFYVVPKEFIVYDQGKTGITVCELDEMKNLQYQFHEAEVYYTDDEYAYIDESVVREHGQIITIPHTTNQYQVSTQKKLEGVYCVNKGFAQFRMIERLYNGKDYVIVKTGIARSINVYDFIWEDASTLSEDQLINE